MNKTRLAGAIAGLGIFAGTLGMAVTPAQAAPADVSPQRVAGAYASDGLHVFVRGTTNYLYEQVVGKSSWKVLDTTPLASSPASTVDSEGRIYVAARASNGNVLYRWREPNGTWTGWQNIGGSTYGAPSIQAIPKQNGQYAAVFVAALDSTGRAQARAFTPATMSPPIAHWASWVQLDNRVLSAAPMLGAQARSCVDTPRENAPESVPPFALILLSRASNGDGMQREVCGEAPTPAPAGWFLNSEGLSSSVASDSVGLAWSRATDGALQTVTRVGVPAAGRRVACTPTVAGYRVPPNGGSEDVRDPRAVLIRDDQGSGWLYLPANNDGTGGKWTNLGGIAT